MMRRNQRKHWYPITLVLIFGLANAGGRTDDNENFEILTEMDSNGEIKTNSTDVEISSGEFDYEYGEYNGEVSYFSSYSSSFSSNFLVPEEPEESIDEEFEVSTIVTLALGASILLIVGTIGAGYCISTRPLRSETRSSMGLSIRTSYRRGDK